MVSWLYRYVFRGIGIVMVVGMITILFLAVSSQLRQTGSNSTAASAGKHR